MKKTILLLSLITMSIGSFAQYAGLKQKPVINESPVMVLGNKVSQFTPVTFNAHTNPLAKTTGATDTIVGAAPFSDSASIGCCFPLGTDSGFVFGPNVFGFTGFAQRYDVAGADSTVQVLGLIAQFSGTVNPATTNTVTFNCWSVGASTTPIDPTNLPNYYFSGFPDASIAQTNPVSFANLGISSTPATAPDSQGVYIFNTPTAAQGASFFIGYEATYTPAALNGDTISLYTDNNGDRTAPILYYSGTDTFLNDWNAIEVSAGQWADPILAFGSPLSVDYFLIPILISTQNNVGVKGVTKNNLTWYGNYPNPANDYTNIKFSLGATANVTVTIMDMNGRKLDVITQSNLTSGTHEINYNTSKLAAGNYLYVIRNNTGDAMASKLTVVR